MKKNKLTKKLNKLAAKIETTHKQVATLLLLASGMLKSGREEQVMSKILPVLLSEVGEISQHCQVEPESEEVKQYVHEMMRQARSKTK